MHSSMIHVTQKACDIGLSYIFIYSYVSTNSSAQKYCKV